MPQSTGNNPFTTLSDAMAEAVAKAGASTLLVNARQRFPASGTAYSPELVLTSDHVVEREEDISVALPDGSEVRASLAGRDPGSDLALLKLEKAAALPVERAARDARVGQLVLALGRPTYEGVQASLGVVSSLGGAIRTRRGGLLERFLRTDAIPYPGFSGGPLVDSQGQVLGVNTSGFLPGASLTIPVSLAWQVAETLSQHGRVKRGFLGIRSQEVEVPAAAQAKLGRQQATGLLLVGIERGSPAEKGGLMVGDIIVGLAGQPVEEHDNLLSRLSGDLVGQSTPVEALRGGQPLTVNVMVEERRG